MIAGQLMVFDGEDVEIGRPALVELTDYDDKQIEIAFDLDDNRRVYLGFRLSDLTREVKEAREEHAGK